MPHIGEFHVMDAVAPMVPVTLGNSPASYVATANGVAFISGGTVSLVEVARYGVWLTVGLLGGPVPLGKGDTVKVTYLVKPTFTFLAQP